MLVEGRPADLLYNLVVSVALFDQDAIGVEQELQSHSAPILVVIRYLINGVFDHHRLDQSSFNTDSNLLANI